MACSTRLLRFSSILVVSFVRKDGVPSPIIALALGRGEAGRKIRRKQNDEISGRLSSWCLPTVNISKQKITWARSDDLKSVLRALNTFQGFHIDQPHMTDFDPFQSTKTQHSPQVLDVESSYVCGSLHGDVLMDEHTCIRLLGIAWGIKRNHPDLTFRCRAILLI
jgi:hypothetical protein